MRGAFDERLFLPGRLRLHLPLLFLPALHSDKKYLGTPQPPLVAPYLVLVQVGYPEVLSGKTIGLHYPARCQDQ